MPHISRMPPLGAFVFVLVGACALESAGTFKDGETPRDAPPDAENGGGGSGGNGPSGEGGEGGEGGGAPGTGGAGGQSGMGGEGGPSGGDGGAGGAGGGAAMCGPLGDGEKAFVQKCDSQGECSQSSGMPPPRCPSASEGGERVCKFECTGDYSCRGVTLDCSNTVDCRVRCSGVDACEGATILCGSGACEVTCGPGDGACTDGFKVDCSRAKGDCTACGASSDVSDCNASSGCACDASDECPYTPEDSGAAQRRPARLVRPH